MVYSKYNNKRVLTAEGTFDSEKEYRRWCELKLLEKAGEIQDLKHHVSYVLIPKRGRMREIKYIADFTYKQQGKDIVEDVKGVKTRVYMLKWRLMEWVHGIQVMET